VTLTAVDGGADYYGRFANPLPTSADFFPIAVWGAYAQEPANMDLDAAAGLNTYVWAADSSYMSAIRSDGRFHVIQDVGNRANAGSETNGWLLSDEDDMSGTATCPSALTSEKGQVRDGRAYFANWGKGLALSPTASNNWWADATEQSCWTNGVDVDSVDMYWFTDPFDGLGNRDAYRYGQNIDNLRHADASDGKMHPHWGFTETGWPFTESAAQGGRAILPAELRAAVWHQIIAGARGIIYFEHSFGGPHAGDQHTIRTNSEGTRPMVTSVDAQIKSLAPVLNAPTVTSGTANAGPIRTMVKYQGGKFYVFAGAVGAASTSSASIPCVGDATATVLGENRTVPVTGGTLKDSFTDPNAIHIYRIDGGSTCGL